MKYFFEEIYESYLNDIYRLAYSYVLNRQDAEDITQRVFIKLYNNNYILDKDKNSIKKWLIVITINECKDLLKSFWKTKIWPKNTKDCENITGTSGSEINLITLHNVKKKYRIPLYLFYFEGYSIAEIASIIGCSEAATKMKLKRGREDLKKEMEIR